jgi:K(+)-stimulated pyrophosphate-energized sodium pump
MERMANLISEGADTFLRTQYTSITLFMVLFSVVIALVVERNRGEFWVTFAFIIGAITSMVSGYIGMWISVRANVRVTKLAHSSLERAFVTAF